MEDLDYHPNVSARNLAGRRSMTIGYHYFGLERHTFRQPLFSESLAGIYLRADELGYSIKLYRLDGAQDYAAAFRGREIDGAIFVTHDSAHVEDQLVPLLGRGYPLVLIGSHPALPHVEIDHAKGARAALDRFFASKRKRIAFLGGGLDFHSNRQKFEAYKTALEGKKLAYEDDLVRHGLFEPEHGYEAMRGMLAETLAVDAVFSAVNDPVATGAARALFEAGKRIPEDVALIGYDNSVLARAATPPLTSVASPFYELGTNAVDMVAEFIQNDEPPASRTLEPSLVVRDSA
jgi:DNA-binding LacI/PurR family transcriptional regulator